MDANGYYIGDPLRGTFRVSVKAIEGVYRPDLTAINLRLIGKRSLSDPDEKALFDSARAIAPRCSITIESNDGVEITGTFDIAGEATAGLRTYKPSGEVPAFSEVLVPVHCALSALYAGATRRKVLQTWVLRLNRDRVEDAT